MKPDLKQRVFESLLLQHLHLLSHKLQHYFHAALFRAKATLETEALGLTLRVASTKAEATLETEAEVQAKGETEKEVKEEAKIAQSVWDTSDNKTQQLMGPAIFNPYAGSGGGKEVGREI